MKRRFPFAVRTMALARKEVLHIVRDVRVIYMALGFPVVLLLLFGYAVTFDFNRLPLGVVDQDHSPASRRLVEAMTASASFEVTQWLDSPQAVEREFRRNHLKVALFIPAGYQDDRLRGQSTQAQLLLDGADGTTTSIAMGYASGISQALSQQALERTGMAPQLPYQARVRFRFNPGMRSALFIVPGLIALILSILAALLTALTVAREWERGSMEQLFATPVGRLEIILGKLLPYVVLGMLQVLMVVTVGTYLFGLPVHGSMTLLFTSSAVFLAGMLAQGLLISVVTRNQQVATQIAVVSTMLPTLLLSGFMFPVQNMPVVLRVVSSLIPSRYFIEILRGVMLKGNGLAELWPDLGKMSLFALFMIALCNVRFKRRL